MEQQSQEHLTVGGASASASTSEPVSHGGAAPTLHEPPPHFLGMSDDAEPMARYFVAGGL